MSKQTGKANRPLKTQAPAPGTVSAKDPYAEIITLARTHTSKHRYLSSALRCIAGFHDSPYAAIHVRYSAEVLQDDCHFGPGDPSFWKRSLQQFLTESLAEPKLRAKLLRAKSGTAKVTFLSAPVFDPSGPAIGAIALIAAIRDDADAAARLSVLESLARLASFSAEFVGVRREGSSGTPLRTAKFAPTDVQTADQLAITITNELRNKLAAEQTALGLIRGNHVRILSISGMDEVHSDSPGTAALRSAMEECLDAGAPLGCQRDDTWTSESLRGGHRLHKQWHQAAKGDAVASMPLKYNDRPAAILSLRRSPQKPFTREELDQIAAQVEPYVPTLLLAKKAERGLIRHVADRCGEAWSALEAKGHNGRKIIAATLLLGTLWFFFGSMSYSVSVPCTVAAAQVRHLTVPYEAVLASIAAVEGDRVRQGDVLCQLDTRDLEQQRAELVALRTVAEREEDRARAVPSPYEVQLARANQTLMETRIAMLDRRIEQASIRAPLDGLVIAGDLRRRIGERLPQGHPLFEVAPLDGWKLELEVPESLADDVRADLRGSFATHARPEQGQNCRIVRVSPTALPRNRQNVYLAEAEIPPAPDLRPGMQGYARIDIDRRAPWWITLHHALDYLRMHLWL